MEEKIRHLLTAVVHPETGQDIVGSGFIEHIASGAGKITVVLRFAKARDPFAVKIKNQAEEILRREFPQQNVMVVIKEGGAAPRPEPKLKTTTGGIAKVIAVASGKGGVGKSTVSVNLAVALARSGAQTGLLDGDIYGPSIPTMLGAADAKPLLSGDDEHSLIVPLEKYGIRFLSIGFFVDPAKALIWRGPMASNALRQLITDSDWGSLDYLVIDLPPGTGDIHLTLLQTLPVAGIVIVTTPQEVALADARKAIQMFGQDSLKVPLLGIVENMSYFIPDELPGSRYYIFGKDGGLQLAKDNHLPLLASIPLSMTLTADSDQGTPAALRDGTPEAEAFAALAGEVSRQLALRNAFSEIAGSGHTHGECKCKQDNTHH